MPDAETRIFVNHGVFSEESIREYLAEGEEQIAGIEEQLLILEDNRSGKDAIGELFRHLHGLKGNTGLLLSEAQVTPPAAHPLHYLQKGSHAVESEVDRFRRLDAFHVSDEEIEFLFQALGFLQQQIKAFREGWLDPFTDPIFLGKLGLSNLEFETGEQPPPTGGDVFRAAAQQGLRAGRAFLDQLPAGELPSLKNLHRAVETFLKSARFAGNEPLAALAREEIEIIEDALKSGNSVEGLPLDKLRTLHGQIETLFSELPETASIPLTETPDAAPERTEDSRYGVIRVDQHKIDELMRIVGQMVVFRNQLSSFVEKVGGMGIADDLKTELREFGESFSRSAEQLQHGVVSLRLLPLRNLFQRLQRLTRDLSASLGKEIRFTTQGDDIQLDKALLDHLGEPLVHLLRNAADHGIESAETRVKLGKPSAGSIAIHAFRDASAVVIGISDDGKGIDTNKVRARAVEAGVLSPDQAASLDAVALRDLIFHPGFSTAEAVSSVSGRGVGLDAVRNTVTKLRGRLTVDSAIGKGTSFQLRLPATILISRGILLHAGAEEYILPIDSVRDLVRIDSQELRSYRGARMAVQAGRVLPIDRKSVV